MRAEQTSPDRGNKSDSVRESTGRIHCWVVKVKTIIDPELERIINEFHYKSLKNGFYPTFRDVTNWYDK